MICHPTRFFQSQASADLGSDRSELSVLFPSLPWQTLPEGLLARKLPALRVQIPQASSLVKSSSSRMMRLIFPKNLWELWRACVYRVSPHIRHIDIASPDLKMSTFCARPRKRSIRDEVHIEALQACGGSSLTTTSSRRAPKCCEAKAGLLAAFHFFLATFSSVRSG